MCVCVCTCMCVFVLKIYQSCDALKKERNGRRWGRKWVRVKKFFDGVSLLWLQKIHVQFQH